jgi:peptidylprolyl isomerase
MVESRVGDRVHIHVTGRLTDGSVFVSTVGREPAEFVVGGHTLEGVALALVGLRVGDRKTIVLPPRQGFGSHRPELRSRVLRSELPPEVRVGDRLARLRGETVEVWVRELDAESAVVDGNHPLSGQTITLDIEVMSIHTTGEAVPDEPGPPRRAPA